MKNGKRNLSLADLAKQVSPAVARLNPGLFSVGGMATDQHREQARALERKAQAPRSRPNGGQKRRSKHQAPVLTVTMIAHIPTAMDGDNLANALKPVRDEIADWIGVDDGDSRIRWEAGQVETRGAIGVAIIISRN